MSTVSTDVATPTAAPSEPEVETPTATAADLRPLVRAHAIAAAVGAVVLLFVLSAGDLNPLREAPLGSFYDAQARSLLDGRWDVPPEAIAHEAFELGGKSYGYFGPMPAVLRLPIVLVTDRFDGRLTVVSMGIGALLTLLAAAVLALETRRLLRPEVAPTTGEAALHAAWTASVAAGSVLLFLVADAGVYHEAIVWGIAWTTCTLAILLRMVRTGSPTPVLLGTALTAAVTARAATAAGAVVVVFAAGVWYLARNRDVRDRMGRSCVVAVAVAIGVYAAVNWAKFGSLTGIPYERHVTVAGTPPRLERYLEDGLFGLRYVPSNALQYLRPDALGYVDVLPWVGFPNRAPTLVGDVRFDGIERSSSIPATMPLFTALAFVGVVGGVRSRGRARMLAVGAALAGAGFAVALGYAHMTHRYLGDALPALLAAGALGLHLVGRAVRGTRSITVVVVVLAAFGVLVNVSLAVQRQRGESEWFAALRRDMRASVGGRFPAVPAPAHTTVPELRAGQFAVMGDCDSVYLFDGERLVAAGRGRDGGAFDLTLEVAPAPPGTKEPVVTAGGTGAFDVVSLEHLGDGSYRFVHNHASGAVGELSVPGTPFRPLAGRPFRVHVVFDRVVERLLVHYRGEPVFDFDEVWMLPPDGRPLVVGRNDVGAPVEAAFTGTIEVGGRREAPGCRKLVKGR